jgi:hypothetical protein
MAAAPAIDTAAERGTGAAGVERTAATARGRLGAALAAAAAAAAAGVLPAHARTHAGTSEPQTMTAGQSVWTHTCPTTTSDGSAATAAAAAAASPATATTAAAEAAVTEAADATATAPTAAASTAAAAAPTAAAAAGTATAAASPTPSADTVASLVRVTTAAAAAARRCRRPGTRQHVCDPALGAALVSVEPARREREQHPRKRVLCVRSDCSHARRRQRARAPPSRARRTFRVVIFFHAAACIAAGVAGRGIGTVAASLPFPPSLLVGK